jgi:hypothetical protein
VKGELPPIRPVPDDSLESGFRGRTDARGRWTAFMVVAIVVVFVGVAVAKPWGTPAPTPSPSLASANPSKPSNPSSRPSGGPSSNPTSGPTAQPELTALPFRMLPAPTADAVWTAIDWHALSGNDPLTRVVSVRRWSRGFVATGGTSAETTTTPVWTSVDGIQFAPLPPDMGATFWPGISIVDLVEGPQGLVALTELGSGSSCTGSSCTGAYDSPVFAWTSSDGRIWGTMSQVPVRQTASEDLPMIAGGPAGLVAMTSGPPALEAVSSDGASWRALPASTLPKAFVADELHSTSSGYVAVGRWMTGASHWNAATLWSKDGRTWIANRALPLPGANSGVSPRASSAADTVAAGPNGMIAAGWSVSVPTVTLWWQSSDGRQWHLLSGYPPLGQATCAYRSCPIQPNGLIAGDGQRIVAVRGGPEASVWTSSDGVDWQSLRVTGDLPDSNVTQVALLPGGLLVSNGGKFWYGQAITNLLSRTSPTIAPEILDPLSPR